MGSCLTLSLSLSFSLSLSLSLSRLLLLLLLLLTVLPSTKRGLGQCPTQVGRVETASQAPATEHVQRMKTPRKCQPGSPSAGKVGTKVLPYTLHMNLAATDLLCEEPIAALALMAIARCCNGADWHMRLSVSHCKHQQL